MIGRVAALVALAGFFVGVPSASEAAVACPVAGWNYHQGKAGGCGYGHWSRGVDRLGQAWFKLSGSVRDTKADGSCARVEVHTRVAWAKDSTRSFRVCGNGKRTAIKFTDTNTASGMTGSVQAWSVRLCVGGSCTAYIDYKPA